MATTQRDMFVELSEKELLAKSPAVARIAAALPSSPILKVYEICEVLRRSPQTVYDWIYSGEFTAFNTANGKQNKQYDIDRRSFLEFLVRRTVV